MTLPKPDIMKLNNQNPDVDAYLSAKGHPMNAEIQRVREIILATDPRITEDIKWSAPTFIYKGNMASYFMNAKKHVSLMFHKGALIQDDHGLLEGDGKEGRLVGIERGEEFGQLRAGGVERIDQQPGANAPRGLDPLVVDAVQVIGQIADAGDGPVGRRHGQAVAVKG